MTTFRTAKPFWHRYRNDPRYDVTVCGGYVQVARLDVVKLSDLRDLRPCGIIRVNIPLTPLWFWS